MNPWLDVLAKLRARDAGATETAPPEPRKTAAGDNATKPTKPPTGVAHDGAADAARVVTPFRAKVPEHEPTKPTKPLFVGFVGVLPGTFSGICSSGSDNPTKPTRPQAWAETPPVQHGCEPQTEGMSNAERERWQQRAAGLLAAGLSQDHALLLVAHLTERDAEGGWNGLRVCPECRHMRGKRGGWWCSAYKAAGSSAPALGQDFPLMFKRCRAFASVHGGHARGVEACARDAAGD